LRKPVEGIRGTLDHGVLQLSADCTSVDQDTKRVSVTLADGRSVEGHVVIGADGLRSTVRSVAFGDEPLQYSGYTIWRGVVPLDDTLGNRTDPAESVGRHALFGVTRLRGSQAFWYATVRADENECESTADEKAMLLRRFAYWHDPIPELIEATPAQAIVRTSLYKRPPLRQWATGRIALLGDAARGMLPNFAQGACQAIEDAAVLADALAASADVGPALSAYDGHRRERALKPAGRPLRLSPVAHLRDPHRRRAPFDPL
jgi:2-polyprenyl-6-methoxyphenol hydroxylase-like FAD-dependent oxidoreductase